MIDLKSGPKNIILPRRFFEDSPCNRTTNKCTNVGLLHPDSSTKDVRNCGKGYEKRRRLRERRRGVVPCCSSSASSAGSRVEMIEEGGEEEIAIAEGQLGNLVSELGWRVRRLIENEVEMRNVAQVQAEAFHVPVALFNDLFFDFFKAEVLSGLVYKLRSSPKDRYACLVAESMDTSASHNTLKQQKLVGVVDVTVLNDKTVLNFLDGAEEYLYISGIAVLEEFRQKVGTVLLKACDILSRIWGFEYLVLRAYDDDAAALKLYTNAGYRIVSGDPPWMTTWIGQKRRVLMIKRSSLPTYVPK
ncbi:hypothetical protein AQUCO_01400096v1 [Aquilegia coerulea]|uniref:N-acetyltransferase domain-containing protein n=1 Tax=Aquilegia coerulea TaxID=218851 RepID=A0A2G5DUH6_AQUCA|nr:hypothetical protein AQUCO_01400096v1 [Aquilegia coerulea]